MSAGELPDGLGDLVERFDHLCVAVHSIAGAASLVRLMGGALVDGGDSPKGRFRWVQFCLPGGSKLEMIEPLPDAGPENFLVRFLKTGGEGLHHVTLKVTDLTAAIARAGELGFDVVGVDTSGSNWKEAFVHPKTANGVLVQLAQWDDLPDREGLELTDILDGIEDRYL